MISVKSLIKDYGEIRAVNGISFEIKTGEVVGFLGPNGAGKTTTMQIITGYLRPTSGQVLIEGRDISDDHTSIKNSIGYLPENTPLYEDLNVYDFLDFVASVRGLNGRKKDSIKRASEVCGILDVLDRPIGELSKGYRQRVGLAQAIIHDPPILILDEPTTGLDPNQIMEIRELIKRLGEEKTVLLSTHILPEVEQTCNRVIVIHKGVIVADSDIDELREEISGAVVRVEYRGSMIPDEFRRFGKVSDVTEKDGNISLKIVPAEGSGDIREAVYRFCKDSDVVLLELYREKRSLEDIFRELTLEGREVET